jgi:hypothetical protein
MSFYLKQKAYISTSSTYLDGQTPPLEVAPCLDPPESQPRHRGTIISPMASAATPVLPQQ